MITVILGLSFGVVCYAATGTQNNTYIFYPLLHKFSILFQTRLQVPQSPKLFQSRLSKLSFMPHYILVKLNFMLLSLHDLSPIFVCLIILFIFYVCSFFHWCLPKFYSLLGPILCHESPDSSRQKTCHPFLNPITLQMNFFYQYYHFLPCFSCLFTDTSLLLDCLDCLYMCFYRNIQECLLLAIQCTKHRV